MLEEVSRRPGDGHDEANELMRRAIENTIDTLPPVQLCQCFWCKERIFGHVTIDGQVIRQGDVGIDGKKGIKFSKKVEEGLVDLIGAVVPQF